MVKTDSEEEFKDRFRREKIIPLKGINTREKLDIALKVIFCFEIFHACGTTNFKPLFTGEPFISFKGGKNMAIIATIKLCIEIIANSHFNSALNIYKY